MNIKSMSIKAFFKKTVILWILVLLCVVLAILSPAFIQPMNLMLVIKQCSISGILAIGMLFVILLGEIDLSIGSVIAFSSVCSAMFGGLASQNMPIIVPILVGLAAGAVFGFINGYAVSYLKIPSFIMTLSTMLIARSVAKVFSSGKPVFGISEDFLNLADGTIFGISHLIYFFFLILILGKVVLNNTVFGSRIYAIGGNEKVAELSGVNTKRTKMMAFVICGLLAGLCGVLMTSRISSGSPTTADGYELNAIAAVVIGGTSMSGGSGTLLGTIVGVLIIGVIQNGLDILGVSVFYQNIIQGLIIFAAVFFDIYSRRKSAKNS